MYLSGCYGRKENEISDEMPSSSRQKISELSKEMEKTIEGLEKKIEDLKAQQPIPPPRRSKQKNPEKGEEAEEEEV